jgi:predicted Zn-dependent protease
MPIELPPGTAAYSDRNEPPKNRHLVLILGGLVILGMGLFWLLGWLLNALIWLIPPSVEQQLGAVIVPAYEQKAKPSSTQDTLNQLLDRLEANLPSEQRKGRNYQVLYIPETTVNAAAIPGDRVLIYAGLLKQMQSENELMMVLGHELGHFVNRDHLRGLGRSLVIQLVLSAFFGDTGSLQSIALSGIAALGQAQFSQGQEKEADEVGLKLLYGAYGQASGATDFFARMSQKEGAGSKLDILATHPPSKQRIEALEKMIRDRGYAVGERSPLPAALKNPA